MNKYKSFKRIISIITTLMLIITTTYAGGTVTSAAVWGGTIATSFGGGDGSSTTPYIISTPEQLAFLAQVINNNNSSYNTKYYQLDEDIDLGGREWTPIGKGVLATDLTASSTSAFKGVFNGNGHTVSNFKITSASTSYLGLFGNVYGTSSSIANLYVSDFNITATMTSSYNLAAGGIAGTCYAVISSCGSSGGTINLKTTASSNATCYAGGLVGRNQGGTIKNSYARSNVSSATTGTGCHSYAGGFIGHITSGNVSYCYSTGNASATSEVSQSAAYAGGFSATNQGTITSSYANGTAYSYSKASTAMAAGFTGLNTSSITSSYATGDVTSIASSTTSSYGGGFVANMQSTSSTATSCFATGNVTVSGGSGKEYTGGFTAYSVGTISYCYYSSSQSISPTPATSYGLSKLISQFISRSFFTSTANFIPIWDFTTDWNIGVTGGYNYPTLIAVPHPIKWSGGIASSFSGGNGTIGAPYEIATAGELALLADNVNNGNSYQGKYFILTANIDLQGLEWIPIGRGKLTASAPNAANAFSGSFDGCCYTVSNFIINTANTAYTGLFGVIYDGAVSNIKINDFAIDVTTPAGSVTNVGGIAGASTGSIDNCYAIGSIVGNCSEISAYVGGVIGKNEGGIVNNCVANVSVTAITTEDDCHAFAGGLVGYNNGGSINTCYSTGTTISQSGNTVTGLRSAAYAGGLTAMNVASSTVTDCYSTSNVSATSYQSTAISGGLIAHNLGDVTVAYSTGKIICDSKTKSAYGGGLIGNNAGSLTSCFTVSDVTLTAGTNNYVGTFAGTSTGTVTNCYYTASQTVTPTPTTTYGTIAAASNLTKKAFYTNSSNFTYSWNMTTIWTIGIVDGYDYPTFIYAFTEAEPELPEDDDPNIDPDGWDGSAAEKFNGGTGSEASPYEIATPGQLLLLANEVNDGNNSYSGKYYKLTDNIDLNYRRWTPIGSSASYAFSGTFDANRYTIDNLKINSAKNGYAGLFGYVQDGNINNVILNNANIEFGYSSSSTLYIGAVVAYLDAALSDCYAEGKITITASNALSQSSIGGLIGYCANETVSGCTSQITIDTATSGITNVGGVIGYAACDIEECTFNSSVISTSGDTIYAGGIVGYISSDNTALNCYSRGTVEGESTDGLAYTGGLAGYNLSSWKTSYSSGEITVIADECYAGGLFGYSNATLYSCFAVNNITAVSESDNASAGGLIGYYTGGSLNNCYRSSSQVVDADNENKRGPTATGDLTTKEYLTNTAYFITPWDFDNIWQFKPATGYVYPILKNESVNMSLDMWEGTIADGFSSGSGTNARPYRISSAAELAYLAYMVNTGTDYSDKSYELTADIDLSESIWVPIGKGTNITDTPKSDKAFCGKFDGNGYTIKNMTVNITDKSGYGLFGCIYNATITNLNLDNINIDITVPKSTNAYAGGIAGISYGSEISYTRATGNIKLNSTASGKTYAGGIVGANYEGIVEVSYSTATVNNTNTGSSDACYSGGIVGYATYGELADCYYAGSEINAIAMGNVKAYAGGIIGYMDSGSSVTVGYSIGDITSSSYLADSYAGGVIGFADNSAVESVFSVGDITTTATNSAATAYAGGIIAKADNSAITKCYKSNQQTVTGDSVNSDDTSPATSPSNFNTAQFLTNSTLFNTVWNLSEVWEIGAVDDYNYPTLQAVPHISVNSEEDDNNVSDNSFVISYNNGILTINASTAVNNALIILAAYDGNTLINTEILSQNISQGDNLLFTQTFTTTGADNMKIMLWNSANEQSQLADVTEIQL